MNIKYNDITLSESPFVLNFEEKTYVPLDTINTKHLKENGNIIDTEYGKIYYYDIDINTIITKDAAYAYKDSLNEKLAWQITFLGKDMVYTERKILKRILTWLYLKRSMVAAGTGFLSDAYDLFVIGNVMLIMKKIYKLDAFYSAFISTAALGKTII
jgi:hypothetical protein